MNDRGKRAGSSSGGHRYHMIICVAAMVGAMWFLHAGGWASGYWILFILVCPLMHLFMGHGSHGNHGSNGKDHDGRDEHHLVRSTSTGRLPPAESRAGATEEKS